MAIYIVWKALKYEPKDLEEINKFFAEKQWGRVRYIYTVKTIPGRGGEGGRSDVVFKWYPGKRKGAFYIEKFQMNISWLDDYIDNNSDIISKKDLIKLQKLLERQ